MNGGYDEDVLNLFIEETRERLGLLEPLLVKLERSEPGHDREAVLNDIFRHLHSTKGNAGYLGLTDLVEALHAAEHLVDRLRKGAEVRAEHVDLLLQAAGLLRSYLAALASGSAPPQAAGLTARLHEAAALASESQKAPPPGVIPAEPVQAESLDGFHSSTVRVPVAVQDRHSSTVRVPVAVLDRLGRLAEEMLVTRNRISSLSASLEHRELVAASKKLSAMVSELQDIAALTRLQPIGSLFAQMRRVVRDAARATGKEVELVVEGGELEVDRRILQELRDPLVHLLRNAVDHGIELPDSRAAAGKPARGRVWLRAGREGSNLVVEVADDGRGVDFEAVRRKAVEQGFISPLEAGRLGEEELVKLLLRPGFTTRAEATEVSGRGVGLDVVAVKTQELGGSVEVRSARGQGTRVRLVVPTSVSVINALVFSARGYLLGLPYGFVQEIVLIDEGQVERYGTQEAFRLRDRLVPLFTLDAWPDRRPEAGPDARRTKRYVLVLRQGDLVAGLWCDGIARFEELIVKPPGAGLRDVDAISGLASLGTGEIVLILEPEKLLAGAGLRPEGTEADGENLPVSVRTAETPAERMILVQGYGEYRYGLPVRLVSRIVRFEPGDLALVGDRTYVKLDGALVPLIDLDRALGLGPGGPGRGIGLILTGDRHPVGLSVSRVVRIGPVDGIARPAEHRLLVGLLNLDDGVYLLPDVAGLVNEQIKGFFEAGPAGAEGVSGRVLVVDDSALFRDSLEAALKSAGFEVVTADTVEAALDRLFVDGNFNLVVTDYMLPERSGLDLIQAIRSAEDPVAQVPIVVVSRYLADSPDLVLKLKAAGADEVVAKFDRFDFPAFLERIRRLARGRAGGVGPTEPLVPKPAQDPDGYHVLAVRAGTQVFGLPIGQVREILTLEGLTPMPVERPGFLGLANIRGEVVPVFDLKGVLEGVSGQPGAGHRADVVVITAFGPLVLRAEGILGTVRGEAGDLKPPAGDPGPLGRLVAGVAPMPGYLLQVLDLEKLAGVCLGHG